MEEKSSVKNGSEYLVSFPGRKDFLPHDIFRLAAFNQFCNDLTVEGHGFQVDAQHPGDQQLPVSVRKGKKGYPQSGA